MRSAQHRLRWTAGQRTHSGRPGGEHGSSASSGSSGRKGGRRGQQSLALTGHSSSRLDSRWKPCSERAGLPSKPSPAGGKRWRSVPEGYLPRLNLRALGSWLRPAGGWGSDGGVKARGRGSGRVSGSQSNSGKQQRPPSTHQWMPAWPGLGGGRADDSLRKAELSCWCCSLAQHPAPINGHRCRRRKPPGRVCLTHLATSALWVSPWFSG